jgi:hypothetical protein
MLSFIRIVPFFLPLVRAARNQVYFTAPFCDFQSIVLKLDGEIDQRRKKAFSPEIFLCVTYIGKADGGFYNENDL